MEGNANRVIATAALISVGVGTLNSFYKHKRPPSIRFLVGSGAAYVILSAIGEAEPEVAKALAVAVAVTVTIGDGGGVLTYINNGELDTTKPKSKSNPLNAEDGAPLVTSADLYQGEGVVTADARQDDHWPSSVAAVHYQPFENFTLPPIPGIV